MISDTWHECYEESLKDVITPESFAHPAKMSWGLAKRIMNHLRDYWPPVDTVFDPMAGSGVVGIAAAYAGYRAVLGELEGHFATLIHQNIAKHRAQLDALGKDTPVMFRHDARHIPLLATAGIVSSPPYATTIQHAQNGIDHTKSRARDRRPTRDRCAEPSQYGNLTYGEDARQIGNLRAILTSPPYADSTHVNNQDQMTAGPARWAGGGDSGARVKQNYRQPEDALQMGNDDYWSAIARVYRECARILVPGAPIVLVVKGYVHKGKYVDLPAQTAEMLYHCGFRVVHWHNASLVARESQIDIFGGEARRARKSFFRRLAEKKGAPPINFEVVICAERKA